MIGHTHKRRGGFNKCFPPNPGNRLAAKLIKKRIPANMRLSTTNTHYYKKGVFIDNKKVRTVYADYLQAIVELTFEINPVTSSSVTDKLNKSRSRVDVLARLERDGFIEDITEQKEGEQKNRPKNWRVTALGCRVLDMFNK
jgi:hypothetical protein